jgi:hypothetical protein
LVFDCPALAFGLRQKLIEGYLEQSGIDAVEPGLDLPALLSLLPAVEDKKLILDQGKWCREIQLSIAPPQE